ncbi:hypothetical protein AP75_11725 [Kaistella haifensis DSM 19056]|uniref:Uncharacterized protein n=1 Tax=Kaistella haifensis DSM 19056 TaxID=1450526 RepID=A0A246B7N0_9FLAO|nr:hypothetical protein AP75_11725 [Kaistella haifensis DSM 19056]
MLELVERIFLETQKDFFVRMVPSYICKCKSPTAVGKLLSGRCCQWNTKGNSLENGFSNDLN